MITSAQNPLVKEVLALREPKGRKAAGLTLIEGLRELQLALKAGIKMQKVVYCSAPKDAALNALAEEATAVEVSDKIFEKLSYGERNGGIIGIARIQPMPLSKLKLAGDALVVVLESVEKPGNLGAVLRTCDAAGVDALIVCDPKTDVYNPNVIRASMGTVFTVPVACGSNEEVGAFLKKAGLKTVGAFPDAKDLYTRASLKGPLAIVLGTEDQGLTPFWQKHCDRQVAIPMKGLIDSLNVSVSAAVLIYEALRQRS